jgi:hypothetical protein
VRRPRRAGPERRNRRRARFFGPDPPGGRADFFLGPAFPVFSSVSLSFFRVCFVLTAFYLPCSLGWAGLARRRTAPAEGDSAPWGSPRCEREAIRQRRLGPDTPCTSRSAFALPGPGPATLSPGGQPGLRLGSDPVGFPGGSSPSGCCGPAFRRGQALPAGATVGAFSGSGWTERRWLRPFRSF